MSDPAQIAIAGIRWFPDENQAGRFYYCADAPSPERDQNGRPTLMLLITGTSAMLQIGSKFAPEGDLVEELRTALTAQCPEFAAEVPIVLAPAPLSVSRVTLEIADQNGVFSELASSPSSGMPPYSAIFSVRLDAENIAAVRSAMRGRRGALCIRYGLTQMRTVQARASIRGDLSQLLAEVGASPTRQELISQIETSIAKGSLVLEIDAVDAASAELVAAVRQQAMDKLIEALLEREREPQQISKETFKVTAELDTQTPCPWVATTDIGDWFEGDAGDAHIRLVSGVPDDIDQQAPVAKVSVDFDPTDLPVALIQVRRGVDKAALRAPDFTAVVFDETSAGPWSVETFYTSGGPPFTASFPEATAELRLKPENLGVALVVVDASALRAAGSTKARVTVDYEPSGPGTKDTWTLHFRNDDWTGACWVVTRDPGLAGILQYELKETTANGASVRHPRLQVEKPRIELSPTAPAEH